MQEIRHTDKLHEWKGTISSAWLFYCPGCKENHTFTTKTDGTGWKFDGNLQNPTFTPSLLYPDKSIRCHLFLQNGKISYCGDCGHELNGKIVEMMPVEEFSY